MTSTPIGADVFWETDPLPVPEPPRPETGDVEWWRARSKAVLEEDSIERSRRLRCPVEP